MPRALFLGPAASSRHDHHGPLLPAEDAIAAFVHLQPNLAVAAGVTARHRRRECGRLAEVRCGVKAECGSRG